MEKDRFFFFLVIKFISIRFIIFILFRFISTVLQYFFIYLFYFTLNLVIERTKDFQYKRKGERIGVN